MQRIQINASGDLQPVRKLELHKNGSATWLKVALRKLSMMASNLMKRLQKKGNTFLSILQNFIEESSRKMNELAKEGTGEEVEPAKV